MTATQAPTPGPLSGDDVNRECKACGAFQPDLNAACTFCGLAPTAPVEASGSERTEDALEALDWIENVFPGQGDTNDQGVTVRGWQRLDQACATIRTALSRPQPSGETREESFGQIGRRLYEAFWARNGGNEPAWADQSRAIRSMWMNIARDAALLFPRPLALGGQHSGGEGE